MNASFKRLYVVSFGLLLFFAAGVRAAIITTGNVTPDPSTTTSSSTLYIGDTSNGTMTVDGGSVVNSRNGYLGYQSGADGVATVEGGGTKWKLARNLDIGFTGTGMLAIQNGGIVEVGDTTEVRLGTSRITLDGGTLSTRSLIAPANQLVGTGTIRTHGLLTDAVLIFDASHPLQQQLVLSERPDQNIVIEVNADGYGTMGAGVGGQGTLRIADGVTLASNYGYLGYGPGSTGTATVTGPGSQWLISFELDIGSPGVGDLTISDGALVKNADGRIGDGKVTVTGNGSTWNSKILSVGSNAYKTGELMITDGGKVMSTLPTSTVPDAGVGLVGTGNATVDGVSSTWVHTGSLVVGGSGNGILLVANGGSVSSGGGIIGDSYSTSTLSSVTITGLGSNWTCTSALTVGGNSRGTLSVSNGGRVTSTEAFIGSGFSPMSGSATVAGTGSSWTTGALTVGNGSSGSLMIADGGTVLSATAAIGKTTSGSSIVTVVGIGSTWTTSGQLAIGGYFLLPSVPLSRGPGTLTIGANGNVMTGGDTTILPKGKLDLQGGTFTTTAIKFQSTGGVFNWTTGTLHVGTYNGNLTNSAGVLAPGLSPGKTTVTGNYSQQAGGSLQIEVGGTVSATQYDLLSVTGNVTIGGQLELRMLNGFLPVATDTFTVLTVGGTLSGAFSNVASGQRLATTDGLGSFLVSYSSCSKKVVLSAFELVPEPDVIALVALAVIANYACTRSRISR